MILLPLFIKQRLYGKLMYTSFLTVKIVLVSCLYADTINTPSQVTYKVSVEIDTYFVGGVFEEDAW